MSLSERRQRLLEVRQPCSALCRMAFLGPLIQTEIAAGFPEKVSDWTVMHLYPRHKVPGDSEKPVNDVQSLSRKPVVMAPQKQYFPISCCRVEYNTDRRACQEEILLLSTRLSTQFTTIENIFWRNLLKKSINHDII